MANQRTRRVVFSTVAAMDSTAGADHELHSADIRHLRPDI
jgi:hypothetical protein